MKMQGFFSNAQRGVVVGYEGMVGKEKTEGCDQFDLMILINGRIFFPGGDPHSKIPMTWAEM